MLPDSTSAFEHDTKINRQKIRRQVFLLIFPLVNSLITAAVLLDIDLFTPEFMAVVVAKLWLVFGLSWLVLSVADKLCPRLMTDNCFLCQLTLHIMIVVGIAMALTPFSESPFAEQKPSLVLPRLFVILEITIYLIVLRLLSQQERAFTTSLNLKESELNVLRSQSNPHFLFNTLNLITSEINEAPENAKEIVFDLADLLRINLRLAQQSFTTLQEELKLVSLYLTLQQKRFKNRLSFQLNIPTAAQNLQVPALLLQPVVENTVKYAVAPYASAAHIKIEAHIEENRLCIMFKDSGPVFEDTQIKQGNGFRILHQTLKIHYGENYSLQLRSSDKGGIFTLSIPAQNKNPSPNS